MKLVVDQLQKRFGTQEVLRGASFTFEQGKIYGLIGTESINAWMRGVKSESST